MPGHDLHARLEAAAAYVRDRLPVLPRAGLVLGSGLGGFVTRLAGAVVVRYAEIPGMPVSRVEGHAGNLVVGTLASAAPGHSPGVAVLQGRVHGYEGWSAEDVVFGVRLLARLGARIVVLTNAAGGVNPSLRPGDLVRIDDHLNLSGRNPLTGDNDERLGPRFPDLTHVYDPELGARLDELARRLGVALGRGVYACVAGPSYETPAEIRMLRAIGADLVGMSTALEVIALRHMGVPVVAASLVTNRAAGLALSPLGHDEVQAIAARDGQRLGDLLAAFLAEVAS